MRLEDFLFRVDQIRNEQPSYELGHDGSDGKCDCVGLPIGATRRCGESYTGIHGSNYFARKMTKDLQPIRSESDMSLGDLVYKARAPGDSGYDLKDRYKKGGSYYNGDLNDYCHIGVVTSVNPLRITHVTSPTAKVDTKIGKWKYHGKYIKIDGAVSSKEGGKRVSEARTPEYIIVAGGNGESPINLRSKMSTSSALVDRVPQGTKVEFLEDLGSWVKVLWKRNVAYVKAEFVHVSVPDEQIADDSKIPAEEFPQEDLNPTEEKYEITISVTEREAIALYNVCTELREKIVEKIGRG